MKTQNRRTNGLIFAIIVIVTAFSNSGCMFPKAKKYFSKNINVAGAVTHLPNSWAPVEQSTLRLRSDELWYRRDFSGNKTTLMWGLFTFTDY